MAVPKKGELLRGYTLSEDFKIVGGGTCQWTFATKDGVDYFVKMFLDPRLPTSGGLGSEAVKLQRRERCKAFERHQRDLMDRVRKISGDGGNLVAPIDFFEHEGQYFKVARKVTASFGAEKKVPTKSIQDRITLCINVCSALQSLHNNKIVHGDLKLDNILLQESGDGGFLAKVIDFDSSYVAGAPPSSEEILGDPPYYSPELLDFIQGKGSPESLTTASDIFSLGVVFSEYMTGKKPEWTGEHNYLAEAVRAGEKITISSIAKDEEKQSRLHDLLRRMISSVPSERPTLLALKNDLKTIRDSTGGVPRIAGGTDVPTVIPVTREHEVEKPSVVAELSDVERLAEQAKNLLSAISTKSRPASSASAPVSRLRGAGLVAAATPVAPADHSDTIARLASIIVELQKLAES